MDAPLILIIILTFAFAATRLETRLLGPRSNLLASLEYAIIGVLAGPVMFGFLGPESLASLEPLLAVVTGFVGFLVGLPLSFRSFGTRTRGTVRFGLVATLITAGILGATAWLVFTYTVIPLDDPAPAALLGAAATLALGGTIIAVESIRSGLANARADGPVSRLLPGAAQTMRIVSVLGFGLVLAVQRGLTSEADFLGHLAWVGVEIAAGVAVGFIFFVFVGHERDQKKLFVATIGIVCLGSGIAEALDFSPLFVNLVAGLTIANLSRASRSLLIADSRLRRPVFAVLLILAGASWTPLPAVLWLVPAAYVLLRVLALRVGARVGLRLSASAIDRDTPRPGHGLLGQGAVALALAVDFVHVTPHSTLSALVLTTLLVSAVVNEIWFGAALRVLLQNAGETGRRQPGAAPLDPASDEDGIDIDDHTHEALEAAAAGHEGEAHP